jgi:phosphate starvation-inducible PhoH-like protein
LKNITGYYVPNSLTAYNSRRYVTKLTARKTKTSQYKLYLPKTLNQENYVKSLDDNDHKIVVSLGPAGTGKTMFACQKAIQQLKTEEIDKIIVTRPTVTVEEEIGFLPGNINKKMDPWTKPIFDCFLEYIAKAELELLLYSNKIEICPLAFMRGRTFKDTFIIADEMQNSSPNQMKMLVTRLGKNSRAILTGDLQQSDIKGRNGLYEFINKVERFQNTNNKTKLIKLIYFDNNDIERSEIAKKVIEIYDYKEIEIPTIQIEPSKNSTKNDETVVNTTTTIVTTNAKNNSSKCYICQNDAALIPFSHYYVL